MIRILIILFCTLLWGSGLQAQTKDTIKPRLQTAKPKAKPAQKRPAAKQTISPAQKPVKEQVPAKPETQKPAKGQSSSKPADRKAIKTNQAPAGREVQKKRATPKNDTAKHTIKSVQNKKRIVKPLRQQDSLAAKKRPVRNDSATAKKIISTHHFKKDTLAKTTAARKAPAAAVVRHPKKDTLRAVDSAKHQAAAADSLKRNRQLEQLTRNYKLTWKILSGHPYYAMAEKPVITPYSKRLRHPGKEVYFYTLAGILLLFAGFKTAFSKYFDDLTTLFFKRTLKQRQLQQQLSQDTLPSFLFNILFTLVAGFYLTLLVQQLPFKQPGYPLWQLFTAAVIFVAFIYLAKFFLLKLIGWLFNMQNLTDAYIFLIFLINKIITLFLLPVIIIAALGGTGIKTITWTLSWLVIGALFLYRFLVTVQMVQKNKRANLLHFFVYFIAFELLPAFVIYKFILLFLN